MFFLFFFFLSRDSFSLRQTNVADDAVLVVVVVDGNIDDDTNTGSMDSSLSEISWSEKTISFDLFSVRAAIDTSPCDLVNQALK